MLDKYFTRIGYDGEIAPTREVLATLCLRHLKTIPFENLDPFFGVTPSLDLAAIEKKLIDRKRGGYCYEHNLLFAAVLESLGYSVDRLVARVRWNIPDETPTPRSHMLLRVGAEGECFHVDVGFGSAAPSAPLRFDAKGPQETPHERFRIVDAPEDKEGGERVLEVESEGAWKPAYRYDRQLQQPIDYEGPNWFSATHPSSHFTKRLITSRIRGAARVVFAGNRLSFYVPGRTPERTTIETVADLRAVYADIFRLAVPDGAEADARLDAMLAECAADT